MRFRPAICIISLLLLTAAAQPVEDRWRIGDFGTTDIDQLLIYAVNSYDEHIKERISSYLLTNHRDTPAGLAAQQWLEGYDSNYAADGIPKRIGYLEKCIALNPKYTPCIYMLAGFGGNLKGGEESSAQLLQRTLDLDPNFNFRQAFISLHQKLSGALKDSRRADLLLEKYKKTFGDSYVWDYDKAMTAWRDKQYDASLELLNSAKTKSDAPFFVWLQIALLKTNPALLYSPGNDKPQPAYVAWTVISEALQSKTLSGFGRRDALEWFIDSFAFTSQVRDTDLYYAFFKTAEMLTTRATYEYLRLIVNDPDAGHAMDSALKMIPKESETALPDELLTLGIAHLHIDGFTAQVSSLLSRGVANQYTERSRQRALRTALQNIVSMGLNKDAEDFLLAVRKRFPAGGSEFIDDFDVYIANQDVAAARDALAKYPAQNQSYRSDYVRLQRMMEAQQSRDNFKKGHSFLVTWYRAFDEHEEVAINFGADSADPPASASADLDKLAALLRSPAAAEYLFEVSGHVDDREQTSAGSKLSERRAGAVQKALIRRGVPAERLSVKGYEASVPRATNETEDGRRVNRRVEIRPIDAAETPRIAEKLRIPNSYVMLPLSGGRWAIAGQYPAYRMDLVNGTRVATYHEGTPTALLHHERYLLTSFGRSQADGNERWGLALYDVKTGEMLARRELSGCGPCSQVAISPSQNEIAYATGVNLVIMDGDTLQIKRVGVVSRRVNGLSKGIVWTSNGKIAVSYTSYDRIYVVNAANLKVEHELTGIKFVHSIALSGSEGYLAAGDVGGKVHIWDTKTWTEQGQLESGSPTPDVMVARSHSDEIAVGGNGGISKRLDVQKLQILESWRNGTSDGVEGLRGLAYSKDGSILFRRGQSGWNAENLLSQKSSDIATELARDQIVETWAFPASNRLLVKSQVDGHTRLEIFNVQDLSRVYDLTPYLNASTRLDVSSDGAIQILDQLAGKWLTFDANTLSIRDQRSLSDAELVGNLRSNLKSLPTDTPYFVKMSSKTLVVFWNRRTRGKPETLLHGAIYDRDGHIKQHFDLELITEALKHGAYEAGFADALSSNGRYLAIWPAWVDGYNTRAVKSKRVYIVDTETGVIERKIEYTSRPVGMAFSGDVFNLKFGSVVKSFELPHGKEGSADYGDESTLNLRGGERLIYRAKGNLFLQRPPNIEKFKDASDELTESVSYFPDLNLVVDVADGLLEFRDSQSLDIKLKFSIRGAGEWIAYKDDGHFVSSPRGTEGLYWNVGEQYLPFEAFRQRFEDASLLRQAINVGAGPVPGKPLLGTSNDAAQQPTALAVESDVFAPPYSLSIAGEAHRVTSQDTEKLAIMVAKTRSTSQPYQLEITLNGRVLDAETAARGLSRIDTACADSAAVNCISQHFFNADLQDGLNVVQVCLVYRKVRLDPQTVVIQKDKAASDAKNSAVASLPQLWFFGVGVSKYADKELWLQYPRADATALADAFKSQEGRVYSKVNIKTLVDDQATAESVRLEMHRFLRSATQQDIVMVFLAGHGALDESQTLYFMTYDAKWDEPYSGLDIGVVHDLLGKRPPAQKAIVMLDICHAGAAGAVRTRGTQSGSDDAMKLLAIGSGITVITASTTRELSEEGPQFGGGHGAFSWALVEGLNGAAHADKSSYVTVTSLESYVQHRVQEITGNNQHPTWSAEHFQDFPVAASN